MGSLVINHNVSAINTQRNLLQVDKQLKTSLEHLSSGERIVRAADGPADLMISEQMRAQIASVEQAIRNSETSVSMVQTTEAALNEVNRALISIRQRAIHAANTGANDENMLAADQLEVTNTLESLDRIALFSQFGTKTLLDGSNGVNGVAAGADLTFVSATEDTRGSPAEGYEVIIKQAATRAFVVAEEALTQEIIDSEVELTLQESGKVATYTTNIGDDPRVVMRQLQTAIDKNGLQLDVIIDEFGDPDFDNKLIVVHREYGSEPTFTAISTVAGVLARDVERPMVAELGNDVVGTINDQLAFGRGRILTGAPGTEADGLRLLYEGDTPEDPETPVGRVSVDQNSLIFQVGPNAGQRVSVSLQSVNPRTIGLNVPNDSGFKNLSQVDVRTAQGAQDTIALTDKAIDDVNIVRATLGAIQKNALEANIRSINVSREELISSESVLRDADMAVEISGLTRNQIVLQSGMAMLGQANQSSRNVLNLLQGL
ncbi:MAG: flagellin [SAR324 cluster bacterium]|nr:flagellin [SAR324 cluster bacterium]